METLQLVKKEIRMKNNKKMTNETKKLDVLVVEDEPECADCAVKTLEANNVNPCLARDYKEAMQALNQKRFDGALIDLYFPEETGTGRKALIRPYLEKWNEECRKSEANGSTWAYYLGKEIASPDESKQPLGFLLAKELKSRSIPCLIVSTAGFGHGSDDNPFYALRVGATQIFDVKEEFEGWISDHDIAKDVYQREIVEKGGDAEEMKRRVCAKYSGNVWIQDAKPEDLVRQAIQMGIYKPIKGHQTYQSALEQLKDRIK